jgi:hypothetical protein
MVDKDKIMVLLKQYFTTTGTITIDDEGLVSCTGYVILRVSKHKRLLVSFDKIDDFFDCSYNQLTTLQGAPKSVSGDFSCHNNQLTTLEGAPQSVGGNFRCHINQLTTLEHSPQNVVGGFECYSNQLTTLEGAPKSVGGDFNCVNNKLATLEGMPDVQRTLFLSYRRKLPLLRCLLAKKVEFDPKPRNKTIETILNKYAGQGEAGAFACGAELAAAGFKANARW